MGSLRPENRVSTEVVSRLLKRTGLTIGEMEQMTGIKNLRPVIYMHNKYVSYKTAVIICKELGIEPTDMGV